MFEWSDAYSVNLHTIDSQHKNLFRLAGDLHRAMLAGEAKNVLSQLLDRLVQYTVVNFSYEERLMQESGYPQFQAHKKLEHDNLTRRVLQFQEDFQEGRIALAVGLLQFLKSWLQHHIMESDNKYAPYVKAKAVPQWTTNGRLIFSSTI